LIVGPSTIIEHTAVPCSLSLGLISILESTKFFESTHLENKLDHQIEYQ